MKKKTKRPDEGNKTAMSKADGTEKKPDGRKISRRLNVRQRAFVRHFSDPNSPTFGNASASYKAAGYKSHNPDVNGSRLLGNAGMRREVERALDEAGATRERSAKVIAQAMKATNVRVFCPGEGQLVYSEPLVDHPTRLKAAEMNHRLRGDFPTVHEQERRALLAIQQNILIVPNVSSEHQKQLPPALPLREIEE